MSPDLAPASYALFKRAARLRPGDVVLAQHDRYGRIIKRVKSLNLHGVRLTGTHPDSVSEDDMGTLPIGKIQGKLIWQVSPKDKSNKDTATCSSR